MQEKSRFDVWVVFYPEGREQGRRVEVAEQGRRVEVTRKMLRLGPGLPFGDFWKFMVERCKQCGFINTEHIRILCDRAGNVALTESNFSQYLEWLERDSIFGYLRVQEQSEAECNGKNVTVLMGSDEKEQGTSLNFLSDREQEDMSFQQSRAEFIRQRQYRLKKIDLSSGLDRSLSNISLQLIEAGLSAGEESFLSEGDAKLLLGLQILQQSVQERRSYERVADLILRDFQRRMGGRYN